MTGSRTSCIIRSLGFLFAVVAFVVHTSFGADGNELPAIGAIQNGTAGAGIASPQDSTWVLMNPASMIDLGMRLDIPVETLFLHRGMKPAGFPLVANPFAGHQEDNNPIAIPSMSFSMPIDDNDAFGVGMFGVEGNKTGYHRPRSTLGYLGNGDRRAELQIAKIPLAYAHRFENGWTVGGSILLIATEFRTDSLTLKLRPTSGDWHHDWGMGIGFQVGVEKKWDKISLAASYTSRQAMQQYHKYEDAIKWNLDLPQKFQIGIAYRPTDKLEIVADYKWLNWSQINQLSEKTIKNGLGWTDQNIFRIGASYKLNDKWTVRAGVSHGNSPVPDEFIFANALTPALGEDNIGMGFTYAINEHSDFSFAYRHCFAETRTDNGRGDLFSKLGKGSQSNYMENAFILQYGYKW